MCVSISATLTVLNVCECFRHSNGVHSFQRLFDLGRLLEWSYRLRNPFSQKTCRITDILHGQASRCSKWTVLLSRELGFCPGWQVENGAYRLSGRRAEWKSVDLNRIGVEIEIGTYRLSGRRACWKLNWAMPQGHFSYFTSIGPGGSAKQRIDRIESGKPF